ncbi:hypothetical protein PFLCHA0_c32920 [Pseudomonas protegens CHA0]|uniref:Uncharacterized protein n=1 Tax=Pseudomonas protegens (strain DSM 19095 / LMG 27888 / CFBP 6595 / CHA0) TaxID=1124983 RepID=A0A2C9EN20_PSEPH|nr:hypothetical protein PFLCHA0_c32920 [Pseudomonas protegens CHA0]
MLTHGSVLGTWESTPEQSSKRARAWKPSARRPPDAVWSLKHALSRAMAEARCLRRRGAGQPWKRAVLLMNCWRSNSCRRSAGALAPANRRLRLRHGVCNRPGPCSAFFCRTQELHHD